MLIRSLINPLKTKGPMMSCHETPDSITKGDEKYQKFNRVCLLSKQLTNQFICKVESPQALSLCRSRF